MCNMVGFRNISVYDYSQVKPEIVNSIVQNHLVDFENYYSVIYEHEKNGRIFSGLKQFERLFPWPIRIQF